MPKLGSPGSRDPVRIVCVSDVHGDKRTMGVPRFEEAARALWAAARHAERIGAWFLFLGDLCDPDDDVGGTLKCQREAAHIAAWLRGRGVDQAWMTGNHDVDEGGSGLSTLSHVAMFEPALPPEGTTQFHVADGKPIEVDLAPGARMLCLPFAAASHAYSPAEAAAAFFASAGSARTVVAAHLSIRGIIAGEETVEMPRGREMIFPAAETRGATLRLSGHYHKRQIFDPGGGSPIHVVGSPLRLTAHDQDSSPAFIVASI